MKKAFEISLIVFAMFFANSHVVAQSGAITGNIKDDKGKPLVLASIILQNTIHQDRSDENGNFNINGLNDGKYQIIVFSSGFEKYSKFIEINKNQIDLTVNLQPLIRSLEEIEINAESGENFGITFLNSVEGSAIYASKKNEVILMKNTNGNLSTNNSRQIYSKVSGLNVWESDAAGLQLGVGGRGLSPSRSSNFNTRQNGYDISADALGYPESYYTPPAEALDRIEVIRGAASLQYGTQFGGVLNFIMKKGSREKAIDATVRQSAGSFGLINTFIDMGGTVNRLNYYSFVQRKQGNGWRDNSLFEANTAFLSGDFQVSEKLKVGVEYTYMDYLSQQPGGLTDVQFKNNPKASYRDRNWFSVNWNLGAVIANYQLSHKTHINSRTFGLMANRKALGELRRIDRPDPMEDRSLIEGVFNNWGNETRLIHRYKLVGDLPSVLLMGYRYYNGNTISKQGDADAGSEPVFEYVNPENLQSDYAFRNLNQSLFAENVFMISQKFSVTPGIRVERISTTSNGTFSADVKHPLTHAILMEIDSSENRTNDRQFALFGLGSSYKMKETLEVYANFSQNYRAINFSDIKIVNPNFRVDGDIQDETGFNADFGFRGKIKNYLVFDVTGFYLKYNNRIGLVLKDDTTNYTSYRYRTNVGNARNRGLEFFMEYNILSSIIGDSSSYHLSVFLNSAFIDARYLSSKDPSIKDGNKVELVPDRNIKTGISCGWKNLKTTFQFTQISQQFTEATNTTGPVANAVDGLIPSYHVMDLSLAYQFKQMSIESGINNLSNHMYFTRRAASYPGPGIIPSEGRNYYLCLQLKF